MIRSVDPKEASTPQRAQDDPRDEVDGSKAAGRRTTCWLLPRWTVHPKGRSIWLGRRLAGVEVVRAGERHATEVSLHGARDMSGAEVEYHDACNDEADAEDRSCAKTFSEQCSTH